MGKRRAQLVREKPVDGLGPKDVKRLVTAIRKVWGWNYARKLCLTRAIGKDGFPICELCKLKVPKVYADHISAIGSFGPDYISQMFVPSRFLQALCRKCHLAKTRKDLKKIKAKKVRVEKDARESTVEDLDTLLDFT